MTASHSQTLASNPTVTSARQAARLAGVGQRTIRRWIDAGLLAGPPPWTDAQVQQAAAAGGQPTRRGTREPHGTPARYDAGCDCPDCRRANTQEKKPTLPLTQVAVELQPVLDALAAGAGYAEALATHGYSRQRITALRRWPVVTQALDTALMAGRDPDLDHGTPGAWRAGCRCPDCRTYHDIARS